MKSPSAVTGAIHFVTRIPRSAMLLPLVPILPIQARRTARRMPRLEPATGPEHGIVGGTYPEFRLIVIGESTAVGVGASAHAEALPGFLAEALGERLERSVAWSVTGKNGATVRKVITELVPVLNGSVPDLVVVTVGINDLIRRRPLNVWRTDLTELITALRAKYRDAEVLVAGMPPVRRFPAIPQPLRMVLGARAQAMDRAMREVAHANGAIHVPMDESTARDRRLFATDGLHPSPDGYHAWANDLARAASRVPHSRDLADTAIDDGSSTVTSAGAFRSAVEAKDLSAITRTLDPAVEFHSPVMVKPYQGRDSVAALLRVLLQTFEDFHYTDELIDSAHGDRPDQAGDSPTQALIFSARVMGKAVQGLDLIRFNDAGLVTGLTVMVRPLPAAMTLARVVGKRMEELTASA